MLFRSAAPGRTDIRFAYSADSGKTWSVPIIVNDDRLPAEGARGSDHMLPAIGVNKDGVVLVAWYDRRESGDNMGWKIRTAASLDGGDTFTPSTVVSDAANVFTDRTEWVLEREPRVIGGGTIGMPRSSRRHPIAVDLSINDFFLSSGHTSGLAVGADGVFHPVWVDNRTGVPQLWTAPVTVRGAVEQHGASTLATLDDITENLTLFVESNRYDRSMNRLTLAARLKNTSKDAVRAPVHARLIGLTSQLGVPTVVGADNGLSGVGAIWEFTSPGGVILPDSGTASKTLTFGLSELRPLVPTKVRPNFTSGLVHFDIRVYGRVTSPKAKP